MKLFISGIIGVLVAVATCMMATAPAFGQYTKEPGTTYQQEAGGV